MTMNLRSWLVLAAVLAAAGLLLAVTPTTAVAQTRPALVKNVDEPGRMPYQAMVEFNGGGEPTCPIPGFCIVSFPDVPAGKRLVVERLTVLVGVTGAGQPNYVTFGDGFVSNGGNIAIVMPNFAPSIEVMGVTFWALSEVVRVYYGPGTTPKVKLGATANFGFVANVSLHGYLIDAT